MKPSRSKSESNRVKRKLSHFKNSQKYNESITPSPAVASFETYVNHLKKYQQYVDILIQSATKENYLTIRPVSFDEWYYLITKNVEK